MTDPAPILVSHASIEAVCDRLAASNAPQLPLDAMKQVAIADRDQRWKDRCADIDPILADIYGKEALAKDDAADTTDALEASNDRPLFYNDEEDPFAGRRWLVYQMLPEKGVALLSGQSRAGKTFCALDLALSVAQGAPFAGWTTDRPGGVLYLAAEGAAEIPTRWKAAKDRRGLAGSDMPFLWTEALPCKLLDAGATARFIQLAHSAACGSACKKDPASGVIGVQKGTTIPMV